MTAPSFLVIGVDTGGTFTDFIALAPGGKVYTHKRLSTPQDPGQAVLAGLAQLLKEIGDDRTETVEIEGNPAYRLVHGSTVATNAVLERKGARTALLVTKGFRDLLLIGRQNRRDLYDLMPEAPIPLIPRELTFEITERIGPDGAIVTPLDEISAAEAVTALSEADVESVAVVFLHSYAEPKHERDIARLLRERGFFVSASHEILPEHREFERASTTVLNAYVSPIMQRYLERLSQSAREMGFGSLRVMQSSGGVTDAASAGRHGVHTILSGPAGGVVGGFRAAAEAGIDHIITFDMGGTSTDVSLVPGAPSLTTESEIQGYPVRVPVIDIHTVGAGGGSIARVDAGGALRVGPESAGADPGPACYGRGGRELTVTDANLLLQRLPADWFLGGKMHLDLEAARLAGRRLADNLGATIEDAAYAVLQVVASNMERAVKAISVERGYDPRDFCLVSFGGAGALHACELAKNLSIPKVLVPAFPGVLSAVGMAVADVVKSYVQGLLGPLDEGHLIKMREAAGRLIRQAHADLAEEGVPPADRILTVQADLRFYRQSFELTVPADGLVSTDELGGLLDGRLGQLLSRDGSEPKSTTSDLSGNTPVELTGHRPTGKDPSQILHQLAESFHQAHGKAYGYTARDEAIQVVAVRVHAQGRLARSLPRVISPGDGAPRPVQVLKSRFATGIEETPVYRRDQLGVGVQVQGPAIVVEPHATTVVPPGDVCRVTPTGALLIDVAASMEG